MDTETHIFSFDETEILKRIVELNDEQQESIETFIEITRYLEERNQLYKMYLFNRALLQNHYTFHYNDKYKVIRNYHFDDRIAINALTISFLSSFHTLVESQREFYKRFGFPDLCSKYYDEHFYYRLLQFLRNFSQHGHLIVSVDSENLKCNFDIEQIYHTPHFDMEKFKRIGGDDIIKEINEKYNDHAHMVYTESLRHLECAIAKINIEFYDTIEKKYIETVQSAIKVRKSLQNEDNELLLFRNIRDPDKIEACFPTEKWITRFQEYKKEAKDECDMINR